MTKLRVNIDFTLLCSEVANKKHTDFIFAFKESLSKPIFDFELDLNKWEMDFDMSEIDIRLFDIVETDKEPRLIEQEILKRLQQAQIKHRVNWVLFVINNTRVHTVRE